MSKTNLVTKDNKLINASYSLGIPEQRLIFLAIIEAREQHKLIDAKGILQIKAKSYQQQFKVEKHTAYEALKSATDGLFEAYFEYSDIHKQTGKKADHVVRWVQKISYINDAGMVELQFTDDVIPLITRLSEQYTEYELKQVSELQSEYSIRLYEIMMQWKKAGKTNRIELEDLRKKLGIEQNKYKQMCDFKKRVLDHAIAQINNYTDITASYEQHKKGRAITGFTFKFKSKQTSKKPKQIESSDFIKMTDKQVAVFSNKLAQLPELGSQAPIGESTEGYASLIAQDLRSETKQKQYHKHLKQLGFKL